MTFLIDKLWAVLRRDTLNSFRYRRGYGLLWLGGALELATFYYLARAVGTAFRPEGMDYYTFLLTGTALLNFLILGVSAFVETVHEAQATGTMEVLMNTNTAPSVTIALSACSLMMGRLLHSIIYIGLGIVLFRPALSSPNLLGCAIVLAFATLLVMSIGILAAALQVWTQRGSLVVWVMGAAGSLLTGTMFPVSSLPDWMQRVANAIPLTHALTAFRLALLKQGSMADLGEPLGLLAMVAIALLPLSLGAFSLVVRNARHEGSLAWY